MEDNGNWLFGGHDPEDDDAMIGLLKKRGQDWSKKYLHEVKTEKGTALMHLHNTLFYPAGPEYALRFTVTPSLMAYKLRLPAYDVTLRWDVGLGLWQIFNDKSIPNLDGFELGWILTLVNEYFADKKEITDYIAKHKQAQQDLQFLEAKLPNLQRAVEDAEINSTRSLEAMSILAEIRKVWESS